MNGRGYFVTGTDTNVGKTYVTCALARRARLHRHRVFAFKPIETGNAPGAAGTDQDLLFEAAGEWQQGSLRSLYRFVQPAAPLVAARAEGAMIDLDLVLQTAEDGAAQATFTLVEGAGGWRVPITLDADMSTLAALLALPVLVVARAGLGTINHTLLTLEAIQRDGATPAAVVLSRLPDEDRAAAESNRCEILRRHGGQVIILGSDPGVLDVLLRS